ncbi:MAG: alpha-glucan family phosphorylase [Dehalococcoidales bacterium]|nr:alpha-glucan family phosphorylase [Dehalococcoidales bacterium]
MFRDFTRRSLPRGLDRLAELALDLRWTWSHESDRLWRMVDPEIWDKTKNPWLMLQSISRVQLARLTRNAEFNQELQRLLAARQSYLDRPGWFHEEHTAEKLGNIAYFSMEFGPGEALRLYAGGLGILAGDYLKTASDLGVPLVGVGLLYQEGYFRQAVNNSGWQLEAYPYNEPVSLPITPVLDAEQGWLRIPLELPGRKLWIRAWQAQIGKVMLYLLDTNDPLNNPFDRGITNKLYAERPEIRLMQEMVLGIGGWRVLKALNIAPEVCHLNEGHTAFAAVERARDFMEKTGEPFPVALCATRAGNVLTTHTPVAAGFDNFPSWLITQYLQDYLKAAKIPLEQMLALGHRDYHNPDESFNMAYLAMRGSIKINGVSRLHGKVSRRIFQSLYPRWPETEVPVGHITNGVHMPSWDSPNADEFWTQAGGKERWLHTLKNLSKAVEAVSDEDMWALRCRECQSLIDYVRQRLTNQLRQRGAAPQRLSETNLILDEKALTIGFARRFTAYKRPNLILSNLERLVTIINNAKYPVQFIVAGKAHPADEEGKRLIQQFVNFAERTDVRHHVVFLEDYDIALAQELVQGVDLWLNTPRRPWEACGTSGMKVLLNGGLNLSELDGWWAEAYTSKVGWAIGDRQEHPEPGWDAVEAEQIYDLLEKEIIPEFYSRDGNEIPRKWVARMRTSMSRLTPYFSSNRMLREYVESVYLPVVELVRKRTEDGGMTARKIVAWQNEVEQHWSGLRMGEVKVTAVNDRWRFEATVYPGALDPEYVSIELYAEPYNGDDSVRIALQRTERAGNNGAYLFAGDAPASRPADYYTVRAIPTHPDAVIPLEDAHILWQR